MQNALYLSLVMKTKPMYVLIVDTDRVICIGLSHNLFWSKMDQQWCLTYYMSESCVGMRDQAQGEMERDILVYYYINGVWAMCFTVLVRQQ